MSFLYELKRRLRQKLPPSLRPKVEEAIYVGLYRLSPARKLNFFNGGYSPAAPHFLNLAPFDREPLQATLYDFVLHEIAEEFEGSRETMLDIGCGLGGGIRVAAERYPNSRITGIDVNKTAVNVCRKRLRDLPDVTLVRGNGRDLPFTEAEFDFIFSVGAASYIGLQPFLVEAARVLKPDGLLTFSVGYTNSSFERQVEIVNEQAPACGLVVEKIVDITKNVFASIDDDIPRRQALINRVPWPFYNYAKDWSDMPGTIRYQEYAEGRRLDYAVVCRKQS
ncbi:MAG: class I SAM-dependent methyltransferase [Alphaproteobacteria bacterium]